MGGPIAVGHTRPKMLMRPLVLACWSKEFRRRVQGQIRWCAARLERAVGPTPVGYSTSTGRGSEQIPGHMGYVSTSDPCFARLLNRPSPFQTSHDGGTDRAHPKP